MTYTTAELEREGSEVLTLVIYGQQISNGLDSIKQYQQIRLILPQVVSYTTSNTNMLLK